MKKKKKKNCGLIGKVFLTELGGRVFGNSMEWIQVAIEGLVRK